MVSLETRFWQESCLCGAARALCPSCQEGPLPALLPGPSPPRPRLPRGPLSPLSPRLLPRPPGPLFTWIPLSCLVSLCLSVSLTLSRALLPPSPRPTSSLMPQAHPASDGPHWPFCPCPRSDQMGNKAAYIHLRGSDLRPQFHQFTAVVSHPLGSPALPGLGPGGKRLLRVHNGSQG